MNPPPLPRPGKRNRWFVATMSIGLLIAVAVGAAVGTWLAATAKPKLPGLWKPNTGQLADRPPQTLALLEPGRVAALNFVSNSTQLPEVELTVNGRPARFMVDTGSSHVWVLSNALERLGLRAEAEFDTDYRTWQGQGHGPVSYVKEAVRFALGKGTSLQVENVLVLPADTELSYVGLVSGSFLETIGGSLDFRDRTLRIDGPRAWPAVKDDGATSDDNPGKP